jgi:16S rRNA (guanine966-N2)-methyltransferase
MVRIIAGTLRSRLLLTPDTPLTQPTKDRVREAVFSSLGSAVSQARVLDLFAGSGALGFEAYSRGAAFVHFNDRLPLATATIKKNIQAFGMTAYTLTQQAFSHCLENLIETSDVFDLIFLDPPYKKGLAELSFKQLHASSLIRERGIIVVEDEVDNTWLDSYSDWTIRHYRYGQTKVSIAWKKN